MPTEGTLHHLSEAVRSLLVSRRQSACVLGLLAGSALVSPAYALASAAAAAGFGLARVAAGGIPRDGRWAEGLPKPYVIGRRLRDRSEIRLTRGEVERNFLVLGTTGSGKSENLLGLADEFLHKGSGMAFVDAKGDPTIYRRVFGLAMAYARADDVLLLNFMGQGKVSHTFNPFATFNTGALFRLLSVLSYMDEDDEERSKGRLPNLLHTLALCLCIMQERGTIALWPGSIREHITLPGLMRLSDPDDGTEMPLMVRSGIEAYLRTLDGFDPERGHEQPRMTLQEHAELLAPLDSALAMLSETYGSIFDTQTPDIEIGDVVGNRRILVVTLPALEKVGDDVARLGQLVTAALEGIAPLRESPNLRRGRAPFLIILDEAGYYMTDGLAASAERAPETGTCWMICTQDIPALKRMRERESARIVAACETKLFMRTEEMEHTASLAMARDESTTYKGVETNVDFLDLKGMGAGEMLVMRPEGRDFAVCPFRNPPFPRNARLRLPRFVHLPSAARGSIRRGGAA